MPAEKIAVVLFADTPLLGQAGIRFEKFFTAHQNQELYTKYIEETIFQLRQKHIDTWFTCEESFQETLLLQHFPDVNGCKVANGDMSEKMQTLTDYFLNYQEYQYVIFIFNSFTIVELGLLTKLDQLFRLTKRGVVLITNKATKHFEALAISFPFTRIYEDIIWHKDSVRADIKAQCQDYGIPCKSLPWEHISLVDPIAQIKEFSAQHESAFPQFIKCLRHIVEKHQK